MATFSHFVEYGFDGDVSVDDVIASLKANEILLLETGPVLEALLPGLHIESARVAIRQLSQESPLKQLFALALVVAYQKELEVEVPELIESLTGVHVSDQYDALVTVVVMLIAIYGVAKAFDRLFPDRRPAALDADRDRLLLNMSERLGIAPPVVDGAFQQVTSGRSRGRIETAARRFFKPVLGKRTTGITSNGVAFISPAAIAEIPSDVTLAIDANDAPDSVRTELMRNVGIVLHATDRDHARSGWAGHITGVGTDRIRMILDKDIRPTRLFGRKQIKGDVLMVYDIDEAGDETPREFHLLSIN